jgi:hypothetical protein
MKKTLALVLVLMLVASSAWAFNDAKHVKVAPNGKGDMMIFPFYYTANGGWQTKLTVINTSDTYSVVAKLIVRSHYYSQELLDFLLYLSPNDVWTGTLTNDGTNTYMESTDDSALAPNGQFASTTNPMKQIITQATCVSSRQTTVYATDSRDYGYVEVIEAWYGNVADAYYTPALATGERSAPPVSKTYLRRLYDAYAAGGGAVYLPGRPLFNVAGMAGAALDRTINVLSGFFEFQNSLVSGYSSLEQATVFADWDNTAVLRTTEATGIGVNVSRNTLGELEASLAAQNLAMPYVNQGADFSVHILNFPTKLSTWSVDSQSFCRYQDGRGPFWDDPGVPGVQFATTEYRCLPYSLVNYDLMENASASGPYSGVIGTNALCEEVNLLLSPAGFGVNQSVQIFNEGWSRYNFQRTGANRFPTAFNTQMANALVPPNHAYYGAPVIPVVLFGKMNGISIMKGMADNGHVYGETNATLPPGTADPNGTLNITTTTGWYNRVPARLDVANYPITPVAGYATAIANPYVAGGATAIASWLPEYQYSNEIIELGIESLYP